MAKNDQKNAVTFNKLLVRLVEQQLNAADHDEHTLSFLKADSRQSLLDQLKSVIDETDQHKAFDSTSLKQIKRLFDHSEKYHEIIQKEAHPSRLLIEKPEEWFRQSYQYMYDPVSLLEVVRYFAGGKSPVEKEIIFRSLIAKLIKTQDTLRVISHNQSFLEHYLEKYSDFCRKYPSYQAKLMQLSEPLSPQDSILKALDKLVSDISKCSLTIFEELEIKLHEQAQSALQKKNFYDALILMIRHSGEDLFGAVDNEMYPVLVKGLTTVIQFSHLHTDVYLFQHIKREYLSYWLIHMLRNEDKQKGVMTYQEGKAQIYEKFEPISTPDELLADIKNLAKLEDTEVFQKETEALKQLSEDEFYELLIRVYSHYKNDPDLLKHLPMAPQALASGGNTRWEQRNIVAQAEKKTKGADPSKSSKIRRLFSMVNSLKSASSMFLGISEKRKEQKKKALLPPPSATEEKPPEKKEEPYRPVLRVERTEEQLEPFFPLVYYEVPDPLPGQKQDYSFSNNDKEMSYDPDAQQVIVDLFNIEELANFPLNKYYTKFANGVMSILRVYGNSVKKIQKKEAKGQKVENLTEEVIYFKTSDDTVVALGVTYLGQNPNLGKFPKGQIAYFRLFVKGELMRALPKAKTDEFVIKGFPGGAKPILFKHVGHSHFRTQPKYVAALIDGLITIVESLPQEEFDLLNDDTLVGFVKILQQKANILIIQNKDLIFPRAL